MRRFIEEQIQGKENLEDRKEKLLRVFKKSVLTASELRSRKVEKRPKLLGEWLRKGDLGFIFAPRGRGKTWFSMAVAKALAIGANEAIRVNATATDGFFVAKQLAEVVKSGNYDLVICGKESLDYNGGMVPGMLAGLLGYNFVNSCTELTIDGTSAKAAREIDGGKEIISASLPLVIGGQKGLVEEKDLRIPNMRGIMTARTKVLTVLEPVHANSNTKAVKFEKPAPKSAVKLFAADDLDGLVNALHNEAKVI